MDRCETCDKESLHSQVQALRELIEVARTVVSTLDLDTLLQAILTSAMHFAETPAGSVALYDDRKKELSLHAHAGLSADFIKTERWELTSGGLTEQVLAAGEIFFVEDTGAASFFNNPIAVREGIKSLICVPLAVHKQIVGVLYLDDFVPRLFDREKMKLISVLSSFAAMAIYNAKLHNKTRLMAITDSLTGLHNQRYFLQISSQEIGRAKRYLKPLSIIMMDVDDFKKFNDTHGHFNGDQVLVAIGEIITRTLRRADFAFRYGGEEFILLLPETGLECALQVAERLRETVANETAGVLREIAGQGVTVSVGVASYPANGDGMDDLFRVVDKLLYKAKETGKNRVYFVKEDLVAGSRDGYAS
ncbi:MAG: diguanylate [Geobacteraceae bacterium]|nr:MAG: diguanylate [Geobacteraceae bacterium]